MVALVAVITYLHISIAFLLIYIFDDSNYLLEAVFVFIGALMNLLAGIMIITGYKQTLKIKSVLILVIGIETLVCSALMAADFILIAVSV